MQKLNKPTGRPGAVTFLLIVLACMPTLLKISTSSVPAPPEDDRNHPGVVRHAEDIAAAIITHPAYVRQH